VPLIMTAGAFSAGDVCVQMCRTVLYNPTVGYHLPNHWSFHRSQVVGILRWSPVSDSGQLMCYVDKVQCSRIFTEYVCFPYRPLFRQCSTLIIRGRYSTSLWGPSTKGIQPTHLLLLLLLSSSLLSALCRVFTIIYLKQIMFLGYTVFQLFCI